MQAFAMLSRAAAGLVTGLCLMGSSAHADPIAVKGGKTQMPISGLVVDLPEQAGIEYRVSSSWTLDDKGSFDARDLIDELDTASNQLAAGNWIVTGYFDAGGCDQTLALEKLGNAWKTDADMWGQHWKVRGGVYTFEGSTLGRQPLAILCTTLPGSERALMLYHFALTKPETLGQDEALAAAKSSLVLQRSWAAYRDGKVAAVAPLKRPEVRNRGKINAARTVTLAKAKLMIDLPDDGFVWLANTNDTGDVLDRMAPSMPDLSIEILFIPGKSCADALALLPADGRIDLKPSGLPAGWVSERGLKLDDGDELTACHVLAKDALLAGVIQPKGAAADVSMLAPVFAALANGRRAP